MTEIVSATIPVVRVLERLGVAYFVGGSVASSVHGVARTTIDADILANLHAEHIEPLVEALAGDYYVDLDMIRDAVHRRTCFNVVHLATMLKVDVYLATGAPHDLESMARRRDDTLEPGAAETRAWVASAEDVVLHKLHWFRLGGEVSERQWHDIMGVIRLQAEALDVAYLRRWAALLAVADLLERALADA
jgi:hypothetical protein